MKAGVRAVVDQLDRDEVVGAWANVIVDHEDVGHLAVAEAEKRKVGAGTEFAVTEKLGPG